MIDQFHVLIFFIELFLALLFSIFLFTHKKGNILANRIFGGFLIVRAMMNAGILCYFFRHSVYQAFPEVYLFINSFSLLMAPTLFLYTQAVLYHDFRLKMSHALHCIPFILAVISKIWLYIQIPHPQERLIVHGGLIRGSWDDYLSLGIDLQILIYLGAALYHLRRYRKEIKQFYSSTHKIHMSWLRLVLIGFITIQSFYMYKHISIIFIGSYMRFLSIWMHLAALIIITIIFYHCLKWPEVFSGVNHKSKYEKSPLSESDKKKYLNKLKAVMASDKPHLNPSITLYDLSKKIAVPSHYLSQILNTCLNQNFFDFVNTYRVEESKKLLTESDNGRKTILEILYETGFNSKSVFNVAFKKHTGMTPSQFRNRQKT